MLKKVISGGQSGADVAGLLAAKEMKIATGGVMPKGFRTLAGPKPEYADLFGVTEHASCNYPPRTYQNVRDSDGTVRFAKNFQSSGELCTLKAIEQYKKPYFDVMVYDPAAVVINERWHPIQLVRWIKENKIEVLNIAGNSEKTCPGIEDFVQRYLKKAFSLL